MRRREQVCATLPSEPPADQLHPVVEVFVEPAVIALHSFDPTCVTCLKSAGSSSRRDDIRCSSSLKLLAYRRQRAARRAWLAEHQVPRSEQRRVWPLTNPRWRSAPSGQAIS